MEIIFRTWRVSVERIPPSATELIAMYNHAARYWQRGLQHLGYPHAYRALFARLRADGWLPHRPGELRVLDAGIGTAAFSVALASTWSTPLQLDGVDIAPAMLEEARLVLERQGIAAQLHHANICALPFVKETFDLVISAHALEHLADPEIGLRELVRVLRPGAPLVLVVTRPGFIDGLIRWKWRYRTIRMAQLVNWLEEAGVMQVRQYPLALGTSLPHWMSVACIGGKES
jgi:SAM-dependent methyltransferase